MKYLTRKIPRALQSPSKAIDLLQTKLYNTKYEQEVLDFITNLKQTSPYTIDPNEKTNRNRLCCIEDWKNSEITTAILKLRKEGPLILIDRKEWEWAMGIGRFTYCV